MRRDGLLALCLGLMLVTVGCASGGPAQLGSAEALTMSSGTNASTHFVVDESDVEGDLAPENVSLATPEGLDASLEGLGSSDGQLAGWITVSATADAAAGDHEVEVSLDGEERVLPVTLEEPEEPLKRGDAPQLSFTARTLDGELVMTTDENVSEAPFPESVAFQEPNSYQPMQLQLGERSQLPGALVDALVGAGVDHSRSVQVDGFFGPETMEDTRERETAVQRQLNTSIEMTLPARQAQQLIPRDAQQGDEIDVPIGQSGQTAPYTIEKLSRQQIQLSLALEAGDEVTLHDAWPGAGNVTNATGQEATIYESPNASAGDTLTWVQPWGEVTEVVEVTEEEIVLRHTPAEGETYERTDPRSGQVIPTEVVDVGEEEIVVEQTNPHPLAGQSVVFDVTVVDRGQAQAAPGPGPQR